MDQRNFSIIGRNSDESETCLKTFVLKLAHITIYGADIMQLEVSVGL